MAILIPFSADEEETLKRFCGQAGRDPSDICREATMSMLRDALHDYDLAATLTENAKHRKEG